MKVDITWTIVVLGTLLHSTQSDTPTQSSTPAQSILTDPTLQTYPTDQSPQSDATDPSSQSNPTEPTPHSNPIHPTPQSDPTDLSPQSNPTVPPSQSDPAPPAPQSDSADPSPQSNPTEPHVQSKSTDPPPQSNPTVSPAQSYPTEGVPLTNPSEPATKIGHTDPPPQSNPADPPPQTDPTVPPALSNPADPLAKSNPAYPHAPSNPANSPTQMNTTDPPPQSNTTDPPPQSNPADPPPQSNPADPPPQSNPADPPPHSNPAQPTTQSDPDVPHRQTDPTDLHKQRHIVNNSNAESVDPAAPDSISTVTPSQQTLEAQTSTIPMTSAPHQTNNNFISTSKTENKTTETVTYDFDLSENSKGDVLLETCKTLGQKIIGKCSVTVEIKDKQLVATIKIDADQYIPKEHYKASPKTEQEDPIKETIPDTLIAILASCGALVLILCCFAAYCTHHRRSYRKNQQHLTEELQTVENGYHDNPTLEVMEVQPEMQEKKVSLNRDFNDSWIVPIDNLLKVDMVDEEDTHL